MNNKLELRRRCPLAAAFVDDVRENGVEIDRREKAK